MSNKIDIAINISKNDSDIMELASILDLCIEKIKKKDLNDPNLFIKTQGKIQRKITLHCIEIGWHPDHLELGHIMNKLIKIRYNERVKT